MHNRRLSYLTIIFLITSCNQGGYEKYNEGPVTYISGFFANGTSNPLLIQKIMPDRFITIDSIFLDEDSAFETEIPVDYPGFYAVRNSAGNYITILCKGNDSIWITSDYFNLRDFTLIGTPEAEAITALNIATQAFLDTIAIIAAIVRDSIESPEYPIIKLEADRNYKAAFGLLKAFSEDFIQKNESSLVSLLALSNELGPGIFVFHPVRDRETFQRVDSVLMLEYPESEAVKKIHEQLKVLHPKNNSTRINWKPGDLAPDFEIGGPNNEIYRLSDLRGKVVLIDFWASWDKPNRKRNEELVNIYRKYSKAGFEILQISLDRNKTEWTEAIEEDKLNWLHGSELSFWDSEIARRYGIISLPASFLIGKEGRIIATGISPQELEIQLKALLIP